VNFSRAIPVALFQIKGDFVHFRQLSSHLNLLVDDLLAATTDETTSLPTDSEGIRAIGNFSAGSDVAARARGKTRTLGAALIPFDHFGYPESVQSGAFSAGGAYGSDVVDQ
jgi:hypothetical protein